MARKIRQLAAATAVAAAFSMLATPVSALDLPVAAQAQAFDGDALNAQRHGRWDDDDIDTGDVIAGVAVLGAIIAIAGAANRNNRRYEERYPQPDDNDYGYRTPSGYQRSDGRGIDRAVDMCVAEVESSSGRVGTVDSATRTADGWRVLGQVENGAPYSCAIGNDGRIGDVFIGDSGASFETSAEPQWDDEDYARAREAQSPPPLPEYGSDDGRYETAKAPDFE